MSFMYRTLIFYNFMILNMKFVLKIILYFLNVHLHFYVFISVFASSILSCFFISYPINSEIS